MDISTLPTDNLYKFLAISGLLILTFSYVAPEYILFQLEIRKSDAIASQQKIIIEGEAIELELERLSINRKIEEKLSNIKAKEASKIEGEFAEQLKILQSAQSSLLNQNQNVVEWRKKVRDQEAQIGQINIISELILKYSLHATIGRLLGLLITIFGFSMWYYKTQCHIDANITPNN